MTRQRNDLYTVKLSSSTSRKIKSIFPVTLFPVVAGSTGAIRFARQARLAAARRLDPHTMHGPPQGMSLPWTHGPIPWHHGRRSDHAHRVMKSIILRTLASDPIWPTVLRSGKLASSTGIGERVFQRILYERITGQRMWLESFIGENLPDLTVSGGPFAGMIYPKLESAGSMLAPKLLGTYESEIASLFQDQALAKYETIVDVGCAEGYYAIGAARSNPTCQVYAYDISDQAQQLCRGLAAANGVTERVQVQGYCSAHELTRHRDERALIVSDCEGFEMELFDETLIQTLAHSDFMIEVHPHLGADLKTLTERFGDTHDCDTIGCVMDLDRMRDYRHPAVDALPNDRKIVLFGECRSRKNCWLIARSRAN